MGKQKKSHGTKTELSIEEKQKQLLQNTIMTTVVITTIIVYYSLCVSAYMYDNPKELLMTALTGCLEYVKAPAYLFPIRYNIGPAFFMGLLSILLNIMFYFTDKIKSHQNVNTLKGSSKWANPREISERYAEFVDKKNYKSHKKNILMSKNVYVSLNTNKHFRALNTMLIGTTGSGKSRYVLKPNLMQMNSSYVITDPKGDILKECGEMLRRNGYNVRVFDILNMGNCDTYNPLIYCDKESDIKKIAFAFIKNTDSSGGKSGGKDPFWDDSMNAFLCATIGLLTMKPKGETRAYAQIPEVMGGLCYEPVFANICEFTRMANAKWDKSCGIELADGVKLGDGKNATANASKLAAIFENLRAYEATLQGCDVDEIEKPYCLREWENFRIAPEKTSTTILMTVAIRLDPFNIEQVRNLTSSNTLDLKDFGKKKDALFLVIPPTDRTYNFLIAFLYTQLFDILYKTGSEGSIGSKILKLKDGEFIKYFPKEFVNDKEAFKQKVDAIKNSTIKRQTVDRVIKNIDDSDAKDKDGKKIEDCWYNIYDADGELVSRRPTEAEAISLVQDLKTAKLHNGKAPKVPLHVRFLMDEFANIGELPEFKDKLATVRGYDISIMVILQSITQLKGMYPDDYEVVDANCPFTIFLGGDENTNNEYISKKIGKQTVKGFNASIDSKNKVNNSVNVEERDLIKPEELGRMDYTKEVVLIYGEQPIMDDKIDYPSLPNYKQTLDYASDIGQDINEFIRPTIANEKPQLTYRPIVASAIPNTFDFTEDAFKKIFGGATMKDSIENAFNSIERHTFDVADSSAMTF